MRLYLLIGLSFLIFSACQNENQKEALVALDLMKHGIPLTILAPDSAEVKMMDLGLIRDVNIKKGDDYYIQIYSSQASTTDVSRVLAQELKEVKEGQYFSKILKEEEAGFLFETIIDSTFINYGFRHVKIQGDREYIFQTGLIGKFTQEDAERMYMAVQNK